MKRYQQREETKRKEIRKRCEVRAGNSCCHSSLALGPSIFFRQPEASYRAKSSMAVKDRLGDLLSCANKGVRVKKERKGKRDGMVFFSIRVVFEMPRETSRDKVSQERPCCGLLFRVCVRLQLLRGGG